MKQIGTLGTIDTLTVGERVFTDLANLLILTGATAASANVYAGLTAGVQASTAYQVTTGKTLKIAAVRAFGFSGASNFAGVLYGDTAMATETGNAIGPTNPVFDALQGYFPPGVGGKVEYATNFSAPAGKYIGCLADACYITAFGYET